MKKTFTICILLILSVFAKAQVKIPETNISFNFPNKDWKYQFTTTNPDSSKVYTFVFSNEVSVDSTSPILKVYTKPCNCESGSEFALLQFMQTPFTVLEEISGTDERLPNKNAIGYIGTFTNSENKTFKLLITNFVNNKHCIEFKFIIENNAYNFFSKDFYNILKSVTIK